MDTEPEGDVVGQEFAEMVRVAQLDFARRVAHLYDDLLREMSLENYLATKENPPK